MITIEHVMNKLITRGFADQGKPELLIDASMDGALQWIERIARTIADGGPPMTRCVDSDTGHAVTLTPSDLGLEIVESDDAV